MEKEKELFFLEKAQTEKRILEQAEAFAKKFGCNFSVNVDVEALKFHAGGDVPEVKVMSRKVQTTFSHEEEEW